MAVFEQKIVRISELKTGDEFIKLGQQYVVVSNDGKEIIYKPWLDVGGNKTKIGAASKERVIKVE